jgi:hypothetical protein
MSVVDIQALRGYDRIKSIPSKMKKLQAKAGRTCSHSECCIKLSVYNETDFCAKHERFNFNTSKNI